MTLHFRGYPDFATGNHDPLCSTKEKPCKGPVTTEPRLVTCNECRRVLRMNPRLDVEDESERRFP